MPVRLRRQRQLHQFQHMVVQPRGTSAHTARLRNRKPHNRRPAGDSAGRLSMALNIKRRNTRPNSILVDEKPHKLHLKGGGISSCTHDDTVSHLGHRSKSSCADLRKTTHSTTGCGEQLHVYHDHYLLSLFLRRIYPQRSNVRRCAEDCGIMRSQTYLRRPTDSLLSSRKAELSGPLEQFGLGADG
jgi:hypothetical protein